VAASELVIHRIQHNAFAPQPNWRFNADGKTGQQNAEGMACFGALRASRSGAG
jgi:hypothetical protein